MKKQILIIFISTMFILLGTLSNSHASWWTQEFDVDTQNGDQLGGGIDAVVFESDCALFDEVTVEYRYDNYTKNQSVYLVNKVNLWKMAKKLFKKDE